MKNNVKQKNSGAAAPKARKTTKRAATNKKSAKTNPKTKADKKKVGAKKATSTKTGNTKPSSTKTGNTKTGKRPARKTTRRLQRSKLAPTETLELFERFRADTPEPKGDLEYTNSYTLLVAVALSAQATDVGVNKATRALFKAADTPQKMLKLGEDKLRDHIRTIGLFRNKAKNVIAMSQMLIENFDGEVPRNREALETLPGVGRKTANVVLNNAFGEPTIAVDTHLFRVSNRTGLAPGKDPLAVELGLLKVVPEEFLLHAHHWLILHGRYTCVARKPKCPVCIIAQFCRFKDKTQAS